MTVELFRYRARTPQGERVSGVLAADSPSAAAEDLRRRALFVTSIAKAGLSRRIALHGRRDLQAFFRGFTVLVGSGIPIRRALAVAIECCRQAPLREALRGVLADIEHGTSLSHAMARRPSEFSSVHTALIAAAEAGGVLDDVLRRIATVLDREHITRRKLQAALVYPAIVAFGACGLVTFLLVRIVPIFFEAFERFGVAVPAPTRIVMQASFLLRSPATWFVAAASALLIAGLTAATRRLSAARLDAVWFSLPVVGTILLDAIAARISRMLGVLLRSGVGVVAALEVIAPIAGSARCTEKLRSVTESLRTGNTVHSAFQKSGLFNQMALALIAVGEEAGRLDDMLIAAADYLDVELEAILAGVSAVIEPVLIGTLGVVVAVIVFSIFLPLYSLIGSIS